MDYYEREDNRNERKLVEAENLYMSIIARNVAREREKKGWSQDDLGFYSGLSRVTICKVENAIKRSYKTSISALVRIAEAFNVSPLILLESR